MSDLASKKCIPCEGGIPPLGAAHIDELKRGLAISWQIIEHANIKYLQKEFVFQDFNQAMRFVNATAIIAESEGHHPDISIRYNKVMIELSTHAIGGLSENDFIIAAKIDTIKF